MVDLTHEPLDVSAIVSRVSTPRAGAIALFLGTTRGVTDDRCTASLDYECYPAMATSKLEELEREARRRWPILECHVVHRLGHLKVGEASVAVAVSTPHRDDAFAAARWLIDTIKEVVPIWKKENWTDGTSEWVHPGLEKIADEASLP
jgi:molybdopterin synthase catalytic subunit